MRSLNTKSCVRGDYHLQVAPTALLMSGITEYWLLCRLTLPGDSFQLLFVYFTVILSGWRLFILILVISISLKDINKSFQ